MKPTLSLIILSLMSFASFAAQDLQPVPEGCVMNWGVTAAFDINIPTTDSSREDFDYCDVPIEYGGAAGAVLRFSWPRGWFVEPGVNVGYDYTSFDPAEIGNPRVGFGRWRVAVPVTGGYIFNINDDFGIGPVAGVELICNLKSGTVGLPSTVHYSSSSLWRPVNFAFMVGFEINMGHWAATTQAHIGVVPYYKGAPDVIYRQAPITAQVSVEAKYYF